MNEVTKLGPSIFKDMSSFETLSDWQVQSENYNCLEYILKSAGARIKKLLTTCIRKKRGFQTQYVTSMENHLLGKGRVATSTPAKKSLTQEDPSLTSRINNSGASSNIIEDSIVISDSDQEPETPPQKRSTTMAPPAPAKLARSGRALRTSELSIPSRSTHLAEQYGSMDTDRDTIW